MGDLVELGLYFLLGYGLPFAVIVVVGSRWLQPGRWSKLDWFALALPGLVRIGLMYVDERSRGRSNVVVEPVLLAFLIAVVGGSRSRTAPRRGRLVPACGLLIVGLVLCFGLYYLFPLLGE